MKKLEFKEGQTYVCKETRMRFWTVGKEYQVQLITETNPYIVDDEGDRWYQDSYEMYATFKLKEENKTLIFKEGQTYVCTKSDKWWWTEGKEYPVVCNSNGKPVIIDNDGDEWSSNVLITFNNQFKLKGGNKMKKLEIKEGQTYVCKRDKLAWWTLDKEYKVQTFRNGILYLTDDEGDNWYLPNDELLNNVFKLKEQPFDLNKLTTAQLKEYVDLLEDKEDSERLLNEFIERVSK